VIARRLGFGCALALLGRVSLATAQATAPNPMDSIRRLPNYRPAHDTMTLLAASRIAKLPPAERAAWNAYFARSAAQYGIDTAAMNRELRAAHRSRMTRAPYTHEFSVKPAMTPGWFASDAGRRIADVILSFQAPNGGWSKHVDFTQHLRRPGESYFAESDAWEWISTIDNNQTTEEIHFLDLANRAHRDRRYEAAVTRGVDYLLAMQYPNGCFPQVYPLEGSYHDAVTFNDNAMVNALAVLQEAADGKYPYVRGEQRSNAAAAVGRGIACIVDAQVRVGGRLVAWGQQHDPLTLAPTSARSYELTSLASLESAAIVDFLLRVPTPSEAIVRSIRAAVAWLAAVPIRGYTYESYELRPSARAGPLWGRLYEIGTNRIIMANRDGVTLYDWNKLTDRRSGYGWYTTAPAATLARFAAWSTSQPSAR
jgi:PelA/Pel-15E family pectate lyase